MGNVLDVAIIGAGMLGLYSGWIQGALETAENMLDDKFDLQTPNWLTLG